MCVPWWIRGGKPEISRYSWPLTIPSKRLYPFRVIIRVRNQKKKSTPSWWRISNQLVDGEDCIRIHGDGNAAMRNILSTIKTKIALHSRPPRLFWITSSWHRSDCSGTTNLIDLGILYLSNVSVAVDIFNGIIQRHTVTFRSGESNSISVNFTVLNKLCRYPVQSDQLSV